MPGTMRTSRLVVATLTIVLATAVAFPDDAGPAFTRTEVKVAVPDVTLIDQHGDEVKLLEIMASDKPVFVDFIFATCTTICPILSAGYSSVQRKLGDSRSAVNLISISIDPEHDGPEELRGYLQRYRAKPGWDFLTGSRADIDRVMRGFDAFIPDKMSHQPLVYIKFPGESSRWIQLDGFASTADLLREIDRASGKS